MLSLPTHRGTLLVAPVAPGTNGMRQRNRRLATILAVLAACSDQTEPSDSAETLPESDAAPEGCRAECGLVSGICRERSEFPNFEQTLNQWSTLCSDAGSRFPMVLVGRCADGSSLVAQYNGKRNERHYFSANGAFVSLSTGSDAVFPPCDGRTYWPTPPKCGSPTVTRIVCGQSPWPVGGAF